VKPPTKRPTEQPHAGLDFLGKKRRMGKDDSDQLSLKQEIDALKPDELGHYDVRIIIIIIIIIVITIITLFSKGDMYKYEVKIEKHILLKMAFIFFLQLPLCLSVNRN